MGSCTDRERGQLIHTDEEKGEKAYDEALYHCEVHGRNRCKSAGGTRAQNLIFEETLAIPGIHSLDIRISNSDIENRFDLMIIIDMEKEALPAYASSEPHIRWKSEYGDRIAKKAIFDCDI